MSRDLHPLLKQVAERDGISQHSDLDHDDFAAVQTFKAILHGPANRIQALHELDQAIAAEDGLRAKSKLFALRRKLSHTHEQMLKAGR
jgi:hypothetical protein